MATKKPLIVCLSETHVTDDIFNSEINIDNYVLNRTDSSSRHTGGTAILTEKSLTIVEVIKAFIDRVFWITGVSVLFKKKSYIVFVLYRSPSSSIPRFLQLFEDWCEDNITEKNSRIIICGDFNLNCLESNTNTMRLKNFMHDMGFSNVVDEITHSTATGGSLIDLVFTNTDLDITVFDSPKISSHRNIKISLKNVPPNKTKTFKIETRGKNIDYEQIESKLKLIRWNYTERDLNHRYDQFLANVLAILNEVAPKKRVKIFGHYKEFWTENVRQATQERDRSYKEYSNNKTTENWEKYKQKRNIAVKTIRNEKKNYLERKIDSNKNNPIEMWKTLKTLVPNNHQENSLATIDMGNGEIISDITLMPNGLNTFYIKSIIHITDAIDNNYSHSFPIRKRITDNNLSNFTLINMVDLEKIVSSLKNKSSPDEICVELLKKCFSAIRNPLLNIINSSLERCEVPNELKLSTIIPIPKVPNTNQAIHLRPINMINATAKVLEKAVYEQIVGYLERNKVICEYQSGFRSKHSCETALQCVLTDWKKSTEDNLCTIAVFLDLQRAFETVDRCRLIKKIESVGIDGMALNWIINYLSNRQQRLKLHEFYSERMQNDIGVPQGSILGPLLFLIYLNDIVTIAEECKIHLFADDTLLYFSNKDVHKCVDIMNSSLERVYRYCCANLLKVNVNKTKWMLLGEHKNNKNENIHIRLNDREIEKVNKFVYLGVTIDSQLKFKEHANQVIKTVAYKVNYLRRCSPYLSQWSKLMIYNSIILPHLNYCSTILFFLNQNEMTRLQKMQNRAMRIILQCSRLTPIAQMLQTLQWLPVKKLLEYQTLIFIFKVKIGHSPVYLQNKLTFVTEIHEYNTRNKNNIKIDKYKKNSTYNSLFYKGVDNFNDLPQEIKDTGSIYSFKRRLKDFLLEN